MGSSARALRPTFQQIEKTSMSIKQIHSRAPYTTYASGCSEIRSSDSVKGRMCKLAVVRYGDRQQPRWQVASATSANALVNTSCTPSLPIPHEHLEHSGAMEPNKTTLTMINSLIYSTITLMTTDKLHKHICSLLVRYDNFYQMICEHILVRLHTIFLGEYDV